MSYLSSMCGRGGRSLAAMFALSALAVAAFAADASAGVVIVGSDHNVFAEGPGPRSDIGSINPFFSDVAASTDMGEGFINQTLTSLDVASESGSGPRRISYRAFIDFSAEDGRGSEASPVEFQGIVAARTFFRIDQPYAYSVRFDVNRSTAEEGIDTVVHPASHTTFFGDNDPDGTVLEDGDVLTGVLPAGQYSLAMSRRIDGLATPPVQADFTESFEMILDLDPVGGGEPNPIPLPPAAWSGLVVLGAAGLARARRKLFH